MKQARFETFGPFEIPTNGPSFDKNRLREFWQGVNKQREGLSEAKGCYVFAIGGPREEEPWYVGLTQKGSFKTEIFAAHKEVHFMNQIVNSKRPRVVVYFLPRVTAGGNLRTGTAVLPSICQLEQLLIRAALLKNPTLRNSTFTKYAKAIQVPGFMNDEAKAREGAAKDFNRMLS